MMMIDWIYFIPFAQFIVGDVPQMLQRNGRDTYGVSYVLAHVVSTILCLFLFLLAPCSFSFFVEKAWMID